jgi:uncharacterized repeat protein (TIGR03803 family)
VISVAGTLYGTTAIGGSGCKSLGGCGTLFSVDPSTGTTKLLYEFKGGSDGAAVYGGLVAIGQTLYGVTGSGGTGSCMSTSGGCGTIYSFDLRTGTERVLYSFQENEADAKEPTGLLLQVGSMLYGTAGGGPARSGTVFSFDPATATEHVVYSFRGGVDGAGVNKTLISLGGLLYGTTFSGGGSYCSGLGCGTVFSVNPKTGKESVLYAFRGGQDGMRPLSGLTVVGDKLFGTTYYGDYAGRGCSVTGCGTVYSISLKTHAEKIVYAFKGYPDAYSPEANLVEKDGTLYGTTALGGVNDRGTIFSLVPKTNIETLLYAFVGGRKGANPEAPLLPMANAFYGTTSIGGQIRCHKNCGVVFKFTP